MIDRAAEELEKEKGAGGVLLVCSGGFAVPEPMIPKDQGGRGMPLVYSP